MGFDISIAREALKPKRIKDQTHDTRHCSLRNILSHSQDGRHSLVVLTSLHLKILRAILVFSCISSCFCADFPTVVPTQLPSTAIPSTIPVSSPSSFYVSLLAGTGVCTSSEGGTATASTLGGSRAVFTDSVGVIYVADGISRVYQISSNQMSPVVGTIAASSSGDSGPATSATLNSPRALWVDSQGRMFIAERSGFLIRKVTSGIITSYAGTGSAVASPTSSNGDGGSATAAFLGAIDFLCGDSIGSLYLSDVDSFKVRKILSTGQITTYAGTGVSAVGTENIAATSTTLKYPQGVFVTSVGKLYVSDEARVRAVSTTQIISRFAGTGTSGYNGDGLAPTSAYLNSPEGLYAELAGHVYYADQGNARYRTSRGTLMYTIGGNGVNANAGNDGAATAATFLNPWGLWGDTTGNLFVTGTDGCVVRKLLNVSPTVNPTQTPTVMPTVSIPPSVIPTVFPTTPTTIPTSSAPSRVPTTTTPTTQPIAAPVSFVVVGFAGTGVNSYGGDGGQATAANLVNTYGVFINSVGTTYIADHNTRVRKVVSSGIISTVVGIGTATSAGDNGPASSAAVNAPNGPWADSTGVLYVPDSNGCRIRVISLGGIITTYAGTGSTVTTATNANGDGGQATAAIIDKPGFIVGDSIGNLYISSSSMYKIRKVDVNSIITTVIGTGSPGSGSNNIPATSCAVSFTQGVFVDSTGVLFVADSGLHAVKAVSASTQIVSRFAGLGSFSQFNGDGKAATSGTFNGPVGIYFDTAGLAYLADDDNARVRLVAGGVLYTVAGTGDSFTSGNDGPATAATFVTPRSVWGDTVGNLAVVGANAYVVRKLLNLNPTVAPTVNPTMIPTTSQPTVSLNPTQPPSVVPTLLPTVVPTVVPTTSTPSVMPSVLPSLVPSLSPSVTPSLLPTAPPSLTPTQSPTVAPSLGPSVLPSTLPSVSPSVIPTVAPSLGPSLAPSVSPSISPTPAPSSMAPTLTPSLMPSVGPSLPPTVFPSVLPSVAPSASPSTGPTLTPTMSPSLSPTVTPTACPTTLPSLVPSLTPSMSPSNSPTSSPTSTSPTISPSVAPSMVPSLFPSVLPTVTPSRLPSLAPTAAPSAVPTLTPTLLPSLLPTPSPTASPTVFPSMTPSLAPSVSPISPTVAPTSYIPTLAPSLMPSVGPSGSPTTIPSIFPSKAPSLTPSAAPSVAPTLPPSFPPSVCPSCVPSVLPSYSPSVQPSIAPSVSSSCLPSIAPTTTPSVTPSSAEPTVRPSLLPTDAPLTGPSRCPSVAPIVTPSLSPTHTPSLFPNMYPTHSPSEGPSLRPSATPTPGPTSQNPSVTPSVAPTLLPSLPPTSFPSSVPSVLSSYAPTVFPSVAPTVRPASAGSSQSPATLTVTATPFFSPSFEPSLTPTLLPTIHTVSPTVKPSGLPTVEPSVVPSALPTRIPTVVMTVIPSVSPSISPTAVPSSSPVTESPSAVPSPPPNLIPTAAPSTGPSLVPSMVPSVGPSLLPTTSPTVTPSVLPTVDPSLQPSQSPSGTPTHHPSLGPSAVPTLTPSFTPTVISAAPSLSSHPTSPSVKPTRMPTVSPSRKPSRLPSVSPSLSPSVTPSSPSALPSNALPSISLCPTVVPSVIPSGIPSQPPTVAPSTPFPTVTPTVRPSTLLPSAAPSTVEYFNSHRKATLPSKQPLSVFGSSDLTFKIVMPFLMQSSSAHGVAFSNITLTANASSTAFVLFGNASMPSVLNQFSDGVAFTNIDGLDSVKRSASLLGDVNGDGHNDFIIGDPYAARCYVLFGNNKGLTDMTKGFTIFGESEGDLTGWSVSGAGDVNNDTLADIIVGAPNVKGVGAFYVINGRRLNSVDIYLNNMTSTEGFAVYGAMTSDYLGVTVSDAGDVNADGCDDVIASGLMTSAYFAGSSYVVYGGRHLTSMSSIAALTVDQGYRLYGESYSYSGYYVSRAGDVNKDGFDDILIGTIPQRSALVPSTYLIFGRASVTAEVALSGLNVVQGVVILGGGMVSFVGDVNNDGLADILIDKSHSVTDSSLLISTIVYSSVSHMVKVTSAPVLRPTSIPSTASTATPSLLPSRAPISPTLSPSRIPSVNPSAVPSGPTEVPTAGLTSPTASPSSLPSVLTVQPTVEPSEAPTLHPTEAPSERPTVKPTQHPSTSPSVIPTCHPTTLPTVSPFMAPTVETTEAPVLTRAPFSAPTLQPTMTVTSGATTSLYTSVYLSSGIKLVNQTMGHQNYIVNASQSVIIDNKMGNNKYTIIPNPGANLTIVCLNKTTDVIDLTNYPMFSQLSDLTIRSGSVIVSLPDFQFIRILNLSPVNISANNFLFFQGSSTGDHGSKHGSTLSAIAGGLIAVGGLIFILMFLLQFCHLSFLHGKIVDEKDKLLMVITTSLDGSNFVYEWETVHNENNFDARLDQMLDSESSGHSHSAHSSISLSSEGVLIRNTEDRLADSNEAEASSADLSSVSSDDV